MSTFDNPSLMYAAEAFKDWDPLQAPQV